MDADEQARRNLATEVRNAALAGSAKALAMELHPNDVAKAVSAVVLASSLRAPGECCCVRRDGQVMEVRVGSCRQGWRARLANIERLLGEFADLYYAHHAEMPPLAAARYQAALREVRAMLDNPAGREG